jgi:putative transposase
VAVLRPEHQRGLTVSAARRVILAPAGIAASIGSVGDAYDNALAETTIGLFKTECVGRGSLFLTGPLRTMDDVEYATMEWVDWFNNRRLHGQLAYVPPDE